MNMAFMSLNQIDVSYDKKKQILKGLNLNVEKGELIGRILNPLEGTVEEEVFSPLKGMLFTLREYPVVSPGSLLARVLGGDYR